MGLVLVKNLLRPFSGNESVNSSCVIHTRLSWVRGDTSQYVFLSTTNRKDLRTKRCLYNLIQLSVEIGGGGGVGGVFVRSDNGWSRSRTVCRNLRLTEDVKHRPIPQFSCVRITAVKGSEIERPD